MASDLPNRPPADPAKKSAPIEATDRVKPVTDKPDPRFDWRGPALGVAWQATAWRADRAPEDDPSSLDLSAWGPGQHTIRIEPAQNDHTMYDPATPVTFTASDHSLRSLARN